MSENVIITSKRLGETPLECLERTREQHKIGANIPMTYAGRLDPMASGLMIVLVGDECKNKDQYLGLDKTYEFEILVGFETDTNDLLGLINALPACASERSSDLPAGEFDGRGQTVSEAPAGFATTITSFIGTFIQKYPNFSSKTVDGRQLFQLAKDDELPANIPDHQVTIYDLKQTGYRTIQKEELRKEIIKRINLVHGNFRQEEIIKKWEGIFANLAQKSFQIISCSLYCSSGTYVRQLVADIGHKLSLPLTTYSINRTQIGEYQ